MATLDVLSLAEAKQAVKTTAVTTDDAELARWVTAVSIRLDKLVGPVVKRAVTDELDGNDFEVFLSSYPVASVTSVVEYDRVGTATTLTRETNLVKPTDGYRLHRYSADPTLFSDEISRRGNGYAAKFADGEENVVVTYTAGRFDDTASVDSRFKSAAGMILRYAWQSRQDVIIQQGEFDVPGVSFPRFFIPKAVRELLPHELQDCEPLV